MTPVRPAVSWPDSLAIVSDWLASNLPAANIVTATNATFGTDRPDPTMTVPLVLLETVPAGGTDLDTFERTDVLDVKTFHNSPGAVRTLARTVHEVMCEIIGERTAHGVADNLVVSTNPGALAYGNRNVWQYLATYELTTRPT